MADDADSELNGEAWFWQVVTQANRDRARLYAILRDASREEIIAFDREFQKAAHVLWRSPYVDRIDADTDDNIRDVLEWVVSQGQDYYFAVVADPCKMRTDFVHGAATDTFSGVVANVFLKRFGGFPPSPWLNPS